VIENRHEPRTFVGEMVDLSIDSVDLTYNVDSDAETHVAAGEREPPSEDLPGPSGVEDETELNAAIRGNIDDF